MMSRSNTPKILAWTSQTLVREYVKGRVLTPKDSKAIVATLLSLHRECWCLGDSKYDNFLYPRIGNEVIIIDAEQSIRSCNSRHKAADLIVSTFFLMISNWPKCRVAKEFITEYVRDGECDVVKYMIHPGAILLLLPCPLLIGYILYLILTSCRI